MGSYDETCGITQLPIKHGDKVRLFVLSCNQSLDDISFCAAQWSPISPPIKGNYNNYGSIENIRTNEIVNSFLSQLKSNWVPFKSKLETVPSPNEITLNDALKWIVRGKVNYNSNNKVSLLSTMMILEDVYKAMVDSNPDKCKLSESIKSWYESGLSLIKDDEKANVNNKELVALSLSLSSDMFFNKWTNGTNLFKLPLIKLIANKVPYSDTKVQRLVLPLLRSMQFELSFSQARKLWTPQAGSSHDCLEIYKVINQASEKIINSRSKSK